MHTLFVILLILSVILLIGGLSKPGVDKKTGKPNKRSTVAITFGILIVLFAILTAATAHKGAAKKSISSINKPATTSKSRVADPHTDYKVVADNNTYVSVLVPTSYDNAATMKQLGETLLYDYNYLAPDRSHVFVYVFDNAKAASYLDDVLSGKDTPAVDAVYDPHFIAEYQRNDASKLNQFTIQLNGGDQDPNPITINY